MFSAVETTTATTCLSLPTDSDEFRREMRVRSRRASKFLERETTLANLVIGACFLKDVEDVLCRAYCSHSMYIGIGKVRMVCCFIVIVMLFRGFIFSGGNDQRHGYLMTLSFFQQWYMHRPLSVSAAFFLHSTGCFDCLLFSSSNIQ